MEYFGARGTLIHGKTWSRKSRVRLHLNKLLNCLLFITLLHRREAEIMQSRWHDLAESRVADSSQANPAKNPTEKQFGPCL